MDQCKNCIVRGDKGKCEQTSCNIHSSWFVEQLKAENTRLRRESEFGKKLALHIRNLPTAKLDSDALLMAHKVLNADAKAAPCIECGETGNHNPLCMSGNRLDGTREDWASKVGE